MYQEPVKLKCLVIDMTTEGTQYIETPHHNYLKAIFFLKAVTAFYIIASLSKSIKVHFSKTKPFHVEGISVS